MKKIGLAVVVVMAVFFGVTGIVKSAENRELAQACTEREQSEAAFISEVRTMLTQAGYENSGINLSRVGDTQNGWEYTVRIHHRKLTDSEQKCELLRKKITLLADWETCVDMEVEFF